jgi:hypothetical protein
MPVPVRSIRLQKRSSQSLDTLSGASGEIFFDADRGTLRLYTANQAENIIIADREWVTANTFSGNYNELTNIPTLVYDYNELSNIPNLATVATTGSYNDLLDLPSTDLSTIDAIGDVDTTTDALSTGQLLQWNGSSWVNATIDGAQDTTYSLTVAGSATNADLTLTPDTGLAETIEFVGGTGIDVGINLSGQVEVVNNATYAINDLSDVNISNPALNEVLAYDGAQWIASTPSTGIALTDFSVGAAAPASGDGAIAYDNTTGVFTYTPPVGGADFSTISITTEAAQGGGTLSFDGVNEFTFRPADLSNALAQLADDTTPVLGGNLDTGNFDIGSTTASTTINSPSNGITLSAPSGNIEMTSSGISGSATGGNVSLTGDTGNLTITNTAALGEIRLTSEDKIDSYISTNVRMSVQNSGVIVTGDVQADTFSLSSPAGAPQITSASTFSITAPDGVIIESVSRISELMTNDGTAVSGTRTFDTSVSPIEYITGITANITVNFINVPTTNDVSHSFSVVIDQGATAFIINAIQIAGVAQTILWADGSAPSGTNSGTDVFTFTLLRRSSAWTVLGSATSYS